MTSLRIALSRIARVLALGLASTIVVASCSSPTPENGTNTNWVSCKSDADCVNVGPTAVCSAGFCRGGLDAGPSSDAARDAQTATCWPPNADTSVDIGDGGFAGCRPEPPCSGTACKSFCPSSDYLLTCHDGSAPPPDASLHCSVVPIPTPAGVTFYCCPCSGNADGADSGSRLPTCTWPSNLDGDASSRAVCHAGRVFLDCGVDGGEREMCVSDDPTRCPDTLNPAPGPCHDQCHPNEYAAACGGVGPGPVPDPPTGCRSVGLIPAGIAYYCCPCGS